MRSLSSKIARAAIPLSVLLTTQKLLANSGIQLPLSQFQAGTEKGNLVPNGDFEQHGAFDANGRTQSANNWSAFAGIYASNQPFNPPANASALGTTVAQTMSGQGSPDQFSQGIDLTTLTPAHSYVLSAYLWNRGRPTQGGNVGDLAEVKIVDTTDAIDNNLTIELEPVALDGGSAGNGYFVYDMISAADLAKFDSGNTQIQVQGEDATNVTGTQPNIWAQFDNVSFTPAENFIGQKWIGTAGGNWGTGSSWNSQTQPTTKGDVVTFSTSSTDQTINIENGKTIGVINFDNPTHRFTLSGLGQLTLDLQVHGLNNAPNGVAEINVLSGSHTISANIGMNRDAVFNVVNANSVLTISGTVKSQTVGSGSTSYSGQTLTKDGAGVLEMKSLLLPNISVLAGTVRMLPGGGAANASRIKSLTLAGGQDGWMSKLDLSNDDMAIDYTGGSSPLATIQNQLKNGYAGGAWNGNGIISTNAKSSTNPKTAIGFIDTASYNPGTFDGASSNSSSVLLKYTLSGDANLDGVVNALDFNALATDYGSTTSTWLAGDFNYDGTVNSSDFSFLANNFGQTFVSTDAPITDAAVADASASLASVVPEPAGMIFLTAATIIARRRRERVR